MIANDCQSNQVIIGLQLITQLCSWCWRWQWAVSRRCRSSCWRAWCRRWPRSRPWVCRAGTAAGSGAGGRWAHCRCLTCASASWGWARMSVYCLGCCCCWSGCSTWGGYCFWGWGSIRGWGRTYWWRQGENWKWDVVWILGNLKLRGSRVDLFNKERNKQYNQKALFVNEICPPCRLSDFACLIIAVLVYQKRFKPYTVRTKILYLSNLKIGSIFGIFKGSNVRTSRF